MYRDEFEDLRWRHGEPAGELQKSVKRNGLLGALDSSYLVPVKVTHLRKLLLGETPFNPKPPNLFAEQNQCAAHAV